MPSTAKASLIGIKGRRKNITGQAPTIRLNRASSFAGAPTPAGRILGAAAQAIARAPLIVEVPETAAEPGIGVEQAREAPAIVAEQGIGAEQPRVAELVVWEAPVIVVEREVAVAQAN